MGVNLTPIIVKHIIRLEDLAGRKLAVDANNYLYQFLALIRTSGGLPLQGPDGSVTSHLAGLLFRSTRLINDFGIPHIQAPSEAEAQAAYMAIKGDVWASSSRDYDSLLFATPRLVRYLTISGKEFFPSKGISRPLKPELIYLEEFLSKHGIIREQLIDMAILIGTDFNEGVKGIGPKTSLKIIKKYGEINNLPKDIKEKVSPNYEDVRKLFWNPPSLQNML